jgi:integrase
MHVRLKGLNSIRKRLADGTVETYWYAWKGGPRLRGEPGDPEFIASYNEALARKIKLPSGSLLSVLVKFENTAEFCSLAARTKADYKKIIDRKIIPEFGDFPLAALIDKRARGIFKGWRDRLALKSPRQADYAWVVLARVLSVGRDRGWIDFNPCEKGGRLYHGTRADKIWTAAQVEAFLQAPPHLLAPLMLALWTGQREGDLLNLLRFAYDGSHIRLVQSKSIRLGNLKKARRVCIPVGAPLKAMLDAMPRRSDEHILLNLYGQPWTEDGFRSSWRKECNRLGIVGVTFNDLRGTAVTRLAIAGCTEAQIATITGHSLGQVRSIMDAHYLHRHPELGQQAIRKLEAGTESPNCTPNWCELFKQGRVKS